VARVGARASYTPLPYKLILVDLFDGFFGKRNDDVVIDGKMDQATEFKLGLGQVARDHYAKYHVPIYSPSLPDHQYNSNTVVV
jgi:hypothetical protein